MAGVLRELAGVVRNTYCLFNRGTCDRNVAGRAGGNITDDRDRIISEVRLLFA